MSHNLQKHITDSAHVPELTCRKIKTNYIQDYMEKDC